jgi:hypothetical protein
MNQTSPVWNSLEIAKLLISAITPLIVLVAGLLVSRSLKQLEFRQWTNQKLTEKRIRVFEELAPQLNDLLCYFTFVGCWKELNPMDVVKMKRSMDRTVHVNQALFSPDFLKRYNEFIAMCYRAFSGWGQDAKLRTMSGRRKDAKGGAWDSAWDSCFAEAHDCSDPRSVSEQYFSLMATFAKELGVGLESDHVPAVHIPSNIR